MATVNGHFHRQRYRRKATANIVHGLVNTILSDTAFAAFPAAGGNRADWRHTGTIVKTHFMLPHIHRFKQMGIFFFINWLHFIRSFLF